MNFSKYLFIRANTVALSYVQTSLSDSTAFSNIHCPAQIWQINYPKTSSVCKCWSIDRLNHLLCSISFFDNISAKQKMERHQVETLGHKSHFWPPQVWSTVRRRHQGGMDYVKPKHFILLYFSCLMHMCGTFYLFLEIHISDMEESWSDSQA